MGDISPGTDTGFGKRWDKRLNAMAEKIAGVLNYFFPHPSTPENVDSCCYNAAAAANGQDPVTFARASYPENPPPVPLSK